MDKKVMTKKQKYVMAGGIAAVVLLVAVLVFAVPYVQRVQAAEKEVESRLTGIIESKEVSINSKLPGRITKIYVEEGDEVKAGQLLAEIEDSDLEAKKVQADAQLKAAQAGYEAATMEAQAAEAAHNAVLHQVEAAKSTLDKANNGARKQEIAQAQAAYDLWKKTYERVSALYEKGAVPAQKVDEVKTQMDVAEQTLSIATEGARTEDKSGAQALVLQASSTAQAYEDKVAQAKAGVKAAEEKVEMAKGVVQEVEAYLKDTKITAPIDGVVTILNSHEGELVSTGMSIATVTDVTDSWIEVKMQETEINKLSLNQKAEVTIPGITDRTFVGKIVRINQRPDFATKLATTDNGDFDIRAFGVKVKLDNSDKVLRPGQTGFVKFE
ncbi:MAG TPA: efflux RND transporter periplasmic adaptor subunit [Negativicutes bacterium]|nr:efflux RND transporter periplasmic adaptor subunit [Negativicutes bacterium]